MARRMMILMMIAHQVPVGCHSVNVAVGWILVGWILVGWILVVTLGQLLKSGDPIGDALQLSSELLLRQSHLPIIIITINSLLALLQLVHELISTVLHLPLYMLYTIGLVFSLLYR